MRITSAAPIFTRSMPFLRRSFLSVDRLPHRRQYSPRADYNTEAPGQGHGRTAALLADRAARHRAQEPRGGGADASIFGGARLPDLLASYECRALRRRRRR